MLHNVAFQFLLPQFATQEPKYDRVKDYVLSLMHDRSENHKASTLFKIVLPDSCYHEHYKECSHMGNHPEHVYLTSSDERLDTQ